MLLRRGHRLHSVSGPEMDPPNLHKFEDLRTDAEVEQIEGELWTCVLDQDLPGINKFKGKKGEVVRKDWPFLQACIEEAVHSGNTELVSTIFSVFCPDNYHAFQIGEFGVATAVSARDSKMAISILEFWIQNNSFQLYTALDVVAFAIQASVTTRVAQAADGKGRKDLVLLVEAAIYTAVVDKLNEVLKDILLWYQENKDKVGDVNTLNADSILHAALEKDKEQVRLLYSMGFRLGEDTHRSINKDHLKMIKLFRARASPVYLSVAFEESQDIEEDDPMKKCLEYAQQARRYASRIQDFNSEFNEVATESTNFALELLGKCTTKHEIQTLLQTKSYRGHHNANFNIAILDGHKEIVAHEKFQQLLHKKWGQRDRVQYGDEIRFNIFWSEMGKIQKFYHFLKQLIYYHLLPFLVLFNTFLPCIQKYRMTRNIIMQSHIPVNRFLYFEISKMLFNLIILATLTDGLDIALWDVCAVFWISSYILEDGRTVHRLYQQGGVDNRTKTLRRWLTFRNMYILITNIIFLVALILRFTAYENNQCRHGCPYSENKMAYIGACLWAAGALLTFLRSIQIGLMWRQTGPIIISMTYMIIDVFVFLFIFVIVYISFTLCTVYIYQAYDESQTTFFNTHKSAFKLFYWTLIRTGNPHFPNIRDLSASLHVYNSSCISKALQGGGEVVGVEEVARCGVGKTGEVGEFDSDLEEGVPYITGNILWAVYQFIVFIVLLSVLRARMVNTYHRIFREADVQWKFFRASIWWKYLDHNSILPPPFTLIFIIHAIVKKMQRICDRKGEEVGGECETEVGVDRLYFNKKYKRLLLTLIQSKGSSWKYDPKRIQSLKNLGRGSNRRESLMDPGGD